MSVEKKLDRTITEAATVLSASGVFDRDDLIEVPHDYYAIGEEIARGGMGRISTARDLRSGRIVAIKEVLGEALTGYPESEREEVLARFCREAILTARLEHPSIVPVYEIGRFCDAPFFAMKRVTGEPLTDHLNAAETFEERLALLPKITSVADAIAYAHDRGVIHRDLKPNNVLVGEFGETLVIDWGLAKDIGGRDEAARRADSVGDLADSIDETLEGSVIGTPQYMPPEQARGQAVDRRADVYSLGALLYHVLAGEPPFPVDPKASGNPIIDVLRRVRDESPTPLVELAPRAPPDLLSIVDKAMARDRDDRYADAGELAADLANFQRGKLVAVHDYSAGELVRRWLRRHRAAVLTGGVLLITLAVLGVLFVVENERERAAAQRAIDRWVSMFEQRGRAELHDGDIATAALILSEAYQKLPDDYGVRVMVAEALRAVDPLIRVVRVGHAGVITAQSKDNVFAFTDDQLIALDRDGNRLSSRRFPRPAKVGSTRDGTVVAALDGRVSVIDHDGSTRFEIPLDAAPTLLDLDTAGRVFGLGFSDGRVAIHSLETGERVGALDLSTDGLPLKETAVAIAFHPKTSDVAIVTALRVAIYSEHQLENVTWTFRPRDFYISAAFSAAKPRLVLGTTLGRATLLDTATREVKGFLDGHRHHTIAVFDFTGERIVTLGRATTRLWNADGGLVTDLASWSSPTAVFRFDPTGEQLALGGEDGTLRVVELERGRTRAQLVGHAGPVESVHFVGDRLISTTDDGVVKLWERTTDLRTVRFEASLFSYRELPGDRLIASGKSGFAGLWSVRTGEKLGKIPLGPREAIGASPNGELIATNAGLFDAANGEAIERFDLEDPAFIAVANDGTIGVSFEDHSIAVCNREGIEIHQVGTFPTSGLLRFTSTGVLVFSTFGKITTFNPTTGELRDLVPPKAGRSLVTFEVSADGQRVATSTGNGAALWRIDGQLIAETDDGGSTVSLHPTENLVAIGTSREIKLWRPPADPEQLTSATRTMAGGSSFSRSGRLLVTVADVTRVWEVETKSILIERDTGVLAARSLLAADDTRLITSTRYGFDVWDMSPERRNPAEVRQLVADRVPRDFESGQGVISRPVPAAR